MLGLPTVSHWLYYIICAVILKDPLVLGYFTDVDSLGNISQPLPPNSKLVTINVTSLYTDIPHAHGLAALEHFLDQHSPNSKPTTAFLIEINPVHP